jgi:hypothetical protein
VLPPREIGEAGRFAARMACDDASNAAAMKRDQATLSSKDVLVFDLRPGGGFVARLSGI